MDDFRSITPKRRADVPVCKKYSDFKPYLQEDFKSRCGYCGDHEFFRETYYEIDHFSPAKLFPHKINDYSNLVYSCRLCNNSKRAKWPKGMLELPNNGLEGWIDPCDAEYSQQFSRLCDGSICPVTKLGTWMWKALTLGNPTHRIKWKLEQLRTELSKLDKIEHLNLEEYSLYKELNVKYRRFEEQLRGVPSFSVMDE